MSKGLIFKNKTSLKNVAVVVFRQPAEDVQYEYDRESGFTVISDEFGPFALNIKHPDRFFSVKNGVHQISDEQADWFENNGFAINRTSYWFVAGKVLTKKVHPKSDHLFVLSVDIGLKTIQIVTNAVNAEVNKMVVVARPGAILPNTSSIKVAKIMGVESEGQLVGLSSLSITPIETTGGVITLNAESYKPGNEYKF